MLIWTYRNKGKINEEDQKVSRRVDAPISDTWAFGIAGIEGRRCEELKKETLWSATEYCRRKKK